MWPAQSPLLRLNARAPNLAIEDGRLHELYRNLGGVLVP
jgi:hypothetical protein